MTAPLVRLVTFLIVSPALATDVLIDPHVDLAVNFRASLVGTATNPWRLTMRDGDRKHEYGGQRAGAGDPLEVVIRAGIEAQFAVPNDPEYAFLGAPGSPLWVLPESQEPGVVFLGLSAENKTSQTWTAHNVSANLLALGIPSGVLTGNQALLRLETFSGPGNLFVWQTDSFGSPQPRLFDTSDGLSAADGQVISPGNHAHFNWAFTAPGIYELGLRASGTLAAGAQFTQSELTTFRFEVIPEPGSAALLLSGLGALALRPRPGRPLNPPRGARRPS